MSELAKGWASFEWGLVQPNSIVGKLSNKVLNRFLRPKLTDAAIKQRDTAVTDQRVFSRIAR